MQKTITLLDESDITFPAVESALDKPDGLLAMGGNLKIDTLLSAYRLGIFPWFNEGEPILWWAPSERMVFYPGAIHPSKSLIKLLRKQLYKVTFNHDFSKVMNYCAETRKDQQGTWITHDMIEAYETLHAEGYALSVEVWNDENIVGGLYGVTIGQVFFGESMFSRESNTSKIALIALSQTLERWNFKLVDCQTYTAHLASLGAWMMARQEFNKNIRCFCSTPQIVADLKQHWAWIDLKP